MTYNSLYNSNDKENEGYDEVRKDNISWSWVWDRRNLC